MCCQMTAGMVTSTMMEDDELLAELNGGDIPVMGFMVVSNKWNVNFHDLFKTILEGDYLIEGTAQVWCIMGRG